MDCQGDWYVCRSIDPFVRLAVRLKERTNRTDNFFFKRGQAQAENLVTFTGWHDYVFNDSRSNVFIIQVKNEWLKFRGSSEQNMYHCQSFTDKWVFQRNDMRLSRDFLLWSFVFLTKLNSLWRQFSSFYVHNLFCLLFDSKMLYHCNWCDAHNNTGPSSIYLSLGIVRDIVPLFIHCFGSLDVAVMISDTDIKSNDMF